MSEATHMCPPCAAGLYSECENPSILSGSGDLEWIIPCVEKFKRIDVAYSAVKGEKGRPVLDPGSVTDPTSTGRKRAALLAPILTGSLCAWAGLRHAGGGVVPILGCNGHRLIEKKGGDDEQGLYQGDRHHGPDKNTLNNAVGANLHSICADCHHRWHALNDHAYDEEGRPGAAFPFTPVEPYFLHDPVTRFSDGEYEAAEAWWDLPKKVRGDYPYAPDSTLKVLPTEAALATLSEGENPFPDSPFAEIGESE